MMAKAAATATTTSSKKKKGRPPCPGPPPPWPAPSGTGRRSLRQRRGRTFVAGLEDSWSSEEERGKRKLKLVVKLPNVRIKREERGQGSPEPSCSGSSGFVDEGDEVESEEEAMKPLKKRKVDGCHGRAVDSHGSIRREERRKNEVWRATTKSASGKLPGSRMGTVLPAAKRLEAILDKLQKKDTYGAFAQPVDPEELPDYHDVIEHPMDFGTVRKRLARGAYRCFEQFEDDVFLICSNAMQYNAPDTIYFRQAHTIQEMARRKFESLRADSTCAETVQADSKRVEAVRAESKSVQTARVTTRCSDAVRDDRKHLVPNRTDSKCAEDFETGSKYAHTVRADSKCVQNVQANSKCVEAVRADGKCVQTVRADSKCVQTALADNKQTQTESKHDEKVISMSKKPTKKSLCLTAQEPVGSDMSSGATLASLVDTCTELNSTQASAYEKPVSPNVLADGGFSMCDSEPEKVDDLSAQRSPSPRCSPSKLVQKPVVIDEGRRETYAISNQEPVVESVLLFVDVESEPKQLHAVGLEEEYSYARSLAHFAGGLGPIAWRIASEKIEKALPPGVKFGPGWVGEYEPLPTSFLSFGNHSRKETLYNTELKRRAIPNRKGFEDRFKATQNGESKVMHMAHDAHPVTGKAGRSSNTVKRGASPLEATERKVSAGMAAQMKPVIANTMVQQPQERPSELPWACANVVGQLRACNSSSPGSFNDERANHMPEYSSPVQVPRFPELLSRNGGYLLPENLRHLATIQGGNKILSMGIKDAGKSNSSRSTTMINFISDHQSGVPAYCRTAGGQEQLIDDPCRLMGFSGKIPYQSNTSSIGILSPQQAMPPLLQPKTEHSSAAAAAAQAWMSIGASAEQKSVATKQVGSASFDNPAWNMPTSGARPHEYTLARPVTRAFPQPFQVASEESMVQNKGLVFFPQLVGNDSPRFRTQSPWQSLSPNPQNKQRKDVLRPDLNIGYQPPGSPVRTAAGILVDSPQPDLALQL